MKRICRYLQVTKDNGLVFNISKNLVVYWYDDADFARLWGHEYPQYPICSRSRTVFVVIFANFPLLRVSKLQTDIFLSTIHSEYVALSRSVKAFLPFSKNLIKEIIDNFGIDSENTKFVSSSTIYEDNNGAISVARIPRMTPTSNQIVVKYHWFRQNVGN